MNEDFGMMNISNMHKKLSFLFWRSM